MRRPHRPLLGEVDTRSAVRDLDVLRAVLGDERLHYLGYSYGTLLGATCAEHFPQRTGRLVLDGAVDPTVDHGELVRVQAAGSEQALRSHVDSCLSGPGCPLTGDHEPIHARGAAPILVVGTTGDPATPYCWSQALGGQPESGHLLTWGGEGHTAYGRADEDLHDAVDAYLLDGTLPAEGTTC